MPWSKVATCSALLLALFLNVGAASAQAADEPAPAPAKVSFYRQVRPLLQRHCSGCHQPAKAGGNFILTAHALLMKGGEGGPAVVAGKVDEGTLLENIQGEKPLMPPKGTPLSKDQVDLISRWIVEGAADDTPTGLTDAITAENPPVYTAPPVITGLAISPDSSLVAVTGYHELLVHKADGSGLAARLVGRAQRLTSVAFSPDGKLLAATGGNPALFGEVQFWSIPEFKLVRTFTATNDTVFGGRFSDDGALFAFGGADNSARIVKVADGEQALKFDAHADWVTGTAFSKDSKNMITISRDRTVKLSVVESGQFIDNITSITPGALRGGLLSIRRHPQKDEFLVGGADGEPKLYKMIRTQARVIGDDFNRLASYQALPGRVFALDFNADGSRFVAVSSTSDKGFARIYETATSAPKFELTGATRGLFAGAYAPDGKFVATAGFDGTVRLYNTETGQLLREFVPVTISPAVATK
jgi:WD40 repeat protein/mono/diheme cytochrome c family protein